VNKVLALLAAAVLLAGCSGSSSGAQSSPTTTAPTATSTATGSPSPEQMAWAGQVCTDVTQLKASIQGLATAATGGGSDVKTSIQTQFATIKSAVDTLLQTLSTPPKGSENDPDQAALQSSAQQLRTSVDTLEARVTDLQNASGGAASVSALAGVATAAKDALTSLDATTQAISTAANDRRGSLGQAFASNSTCAPLRS
jgi:hypothetical protein